MFKKCKHKWTKQSDTIMQSAAMDLQSSQNKASLEMGGSMPVEFIRKCHVVILTCDLCGTIRKEVTYNPAY
jgi:aromatic ring-opening dioxygenase LigB subunit